MVTGGSGFVGATMLLKLGNSKIDTINFDIAPPPPNVEKALSPVKKYIKFVKGNFLDLSAMKEIAKKHSVDKIIHMARRSTGGSALDDPPSVRFDVDGMFNILELGRIQDVKSLVFTSSQMVYGPKQYSPVDEEHPTKPIEPYGAQKLMCEQIGIHYHELYGLNFKTVRFTAPYGTFGTSGIWIHLLIKNAVKGLPTIASSGGDYAADFFDSRDAADGVLLALNSKETTHRIFNLCSGKTTTLKKLITVTKKLVPEAIIKIGPGCTDSSFGNYPSLQKQAKDLFTIPYSIDRAKNELGYNPKISIEAGMKNYYQWVVKEESI